MQQRDATSTRSPRASQPNWPSTDTIHLVAAAAPTVTITAPSPASQFTPGTLVQFTGTATPGTPGEVLTISWTDSVDGAAWESFVARASPRQLQLFGFPPPGHRYWTEETLEGMRRRYPGLDPSPWRG